jgi:hypothetical protein
VLSISISALALKHEVQTYELILRSKSNLKRSSASSSASSQEIVRGHEPTLPLWSVQLRDSREVSVRPVQIRSMLRITCGIWTGSRAIFNRDAV